jgi:hypothetical protein
MAAKGQSRNHVTKAAALGMGYGSGKSVFSAQLDLYRAMMSMSSDGYSRFRSFAERFLIERASTFRTDHMAEDTWQCVQDAKRAYGLIRSTGKVEED